MELKDLPGRAFLDTSVVNFILDYGEQIHEGVSYPEGTSERSVQDIDSLYNIFFTGKRASWQLAISPHTYQEVIRTEEPTRRHNLENWFFEIWNYWHEVVNQNDDLPSFIKAENIRVQLLATGALDALTDMEDRVLVCDAIVYRCDCFCTRDWRTILRHRDKLEALPMRILTPTEWWSLIRPYAGLWA